MSAFRLCAYDNLDQLSALRPAWDELLLQYPQATTFSTCEWLASWWQSFGQHRQLLFLALFDATSLIGLAPLSISTERFGPSSLRVLRMMGDGSNDSDNLDFPVRPGFEITFVESLIAYLKKEKQKWDVALLNTLPANTCVGTSLAKSLTSTWWTFFEYSSQCSAVTLPDSWDLYLQMLASEDRKNLARYTRRLKGRYSVRICRCTQEDELPAYLDALFRLHQARWQASGEPGSFSSQARREFYQLLSLRLLKRDCLELWALELNGELAAVQFAFRHRDKVFQLQEGYDTQRTPDRLGFVLRGAVLERLISENVRVYDFLGGEDSYKARWGSQAGHYRNLHFAPAFGVGACWLQFVNKTSRGKNWLRENLPQSAWKLLHRANVALQKTNTTGSQQPV